MARAGHTAGQNDHFGLGVAEHRIGDINTDGNAVRAHNRITAANANGGNVAACAAQKIKGSECLYLFKSVCQKHINHIAISFTEFPRSA
jgi:hypothetical protein